jgi:MFS superfamily sulfate permease-like transporter
MARELVARAPSPARHFVIDAAALTDIDFSAGRTLRDLISEMRGKGVDVIIGRVSADLLADLNRLGIAEAIGDGKIFPTLHQALAAAGFVDKLRFG